MDYDVFISYASEDKSIARPLALELKKTDIRVWFDEFELRPGSRLRRSIDSGLANSRYGIVILSPNYFAKKWAQQELDALVARETPDEIVIIPIWHNITEDQVKRYSPTMADRKAIPSDKGLEYVVGEFLKVIRPIASVPVAPPLAPTIIALKEQEKAVRDQMIRQLTDLIPRFSSAESRSEWNEVIEIGEGILRSGLATAYKLRGMNHVERDEYNPAITDFCRALVLDPKSDELYYLRGTSYIAREEWDQAIADFKQAIRLDSQKADYYFGRAMCYFAKDKYAQAINDYNHAIKLDRDKADWYYWRGTSYYRKGEYDRAIANFDQAIHLDSRGAHYFGLRGINYQNKGDHNRATDDFNRAIALDGDEARYYRWRAQSLVLLGDHEAAQRDFERAADLERESQSRNVQGVDAAGTKG